eukprot:scaffold718_cov22-Tisochrysis_lutea.AAC.1
MSYVDSSSISAQCQLNVMHGQRLLLAQSPYAPLGQSTLRRAVLPNTQIESYSYAAPAASCASMCLFLLTHSDLNRT